LWHQFTRPRSRGQEGAAYHEAQLSPLVQEIPVHIDAVGLAEVLGDQGTDRRQIFLLEGMLVLYISQFRRQFSHIFLVHHDVEDEIKNRELKERRRAHDKVELPVQLDEGTRKRGTLLLFARERRG
jgi:hypothetical protein